MSYLYICYSLGMKTILVTGVNGFVGRHLAAELTRQGHSVLGTGMKDTMPPELQPYITTYHGGCDLTNAANVAKLPLDQVDAVVNLAGLAQVGASEGQESKYNHINVAVHTVLADRLVKLRYFNTRLLAISTGAVYDNHQPMPLREDSRLLAGNGSPYALSKVAMEQALEKHRRKGLDLVISRSFNHIGPGQLPGFLVPDLTKQVLSSNVVLGGDLSTERDYTDVRDVVKAYALLATQPALNHHIYNVCSGKAVSGQVIFEKIVAATGKNIKDITIKVDQKLIRQNDPQRIVGDNTRLVKDTKWQPTKSLDETINDFVADFMN